MVKLPKIYHPKTCSPVLQFFNQAGWRFLFAPVDIAILVYVRIAFGGIMLWEVWRYFDKGWIARYWIDPILNFPYFGFEWFHPWPGQGMYLHFIGLGILASFIALGFWYRASTVLFFLGFTYMFLLEKARYLNHFYLICLISFLLIFIPAHRAFSIDAWRRPGMRTSTAPAWTLWLLRIQIGIPYFYGGLAKINGDWLQGEPMRMWMAERMDFPLIGSLFTQEWMVYFLSYGGLLLDVLVVPFLVWRRTRVYAFGASLVFHLMNVQLFNIGIFPWFMIAATAIFFSPDWPRRLVKQRSCDRNQAPPARLTPRHRLILTLLGIYLFLQLVLPFRHYLYPGDANWTEEGHRFAWHMKLRDKNTDIRFVITNKLDGTVSHLDPDDFMPRWQVRKMAARPDMILQLSHIIAEDVGGADQDSIEVRAEALASLNGREKQLLIDPTVDLSKEHQSLLPADWILPLETPLNE
ncbi:vitamin k-dependent gamma-carboxylase [Leptolyngbya sp. Heron Island J]|uniref:HTTM domain-containing protein n=1 Tax=Leptolyngbya sp. Heron Island J TaxID=1385935 RepID=UPI0003B9794E|nr:HTTM domain-containing protein [Leptolyngbya sp. Heron Island J]ESA38811.1 vitamin k-dependent gamma-carboxylase [Leptolyngbya sp. Heron Island J]